MGIHLRIMCWNIAEGSLTNQKPANSKLPAIAEQIRLKAPDIVLLNEVKHWDLFAGGWLGNRINQTERLAELTGLPYYQWGKTVRTGWTGHKCVSVLSRFPLGNATVHPVMLGTEATTYAMLETSLVADNRLHHIFSTRFSAHHLDQNYAGHQQATALIQRVNPDEPVIFGGDLNAGRDHVQTKAFVTNSGLTDPLVVRPDPFAFDGDPIDHIFYRGPYGVTRTEVRKPWVEAGIEDISDHLWVYIELVSPPSGFVAKYRSILRLRHFVTGRTLHSHAYNYEHPGSSYQQQVTAYEGIDDNDLWRVKGPHGQSEDHRAGDVVQHGDIIRLEHVLTRRNLHSHSHPSPVTRQQEVTCFGNNGIGDANDNWRVEIEGGGSWEAGKRVRLIHIATDHALHSHFGHSHAEWTREQQEVTALASRDDNDWWLLFEDYVTLL